MVERFVRLHVALMNVLWRAFGVGSVVVGLLLSYDAVTTGGPVGSVATGLTISLIGASTFLVGPLKPAHIVSWAKTLGVTLPDGGADKPSAEAPNNSLERSREG